MDSIGGLDDLRELLQGWRRCRERIGFVPTMGNLHEGHLQLVRRARSLTDRVVVSIFVNPMQFGPGEDFDSYPRTLEDDKALLEQEQVDLLFAPAVDLVYPSGLNETTRVQVPGVGEGLEADARPGFFVGVATVVARLFNLVQADIAVFGEKDYQQLAVIRRMVKDLCWPIDIEAVPTVREADGLAMSSRNQYLSAGQRKQAPVLYQTLCQVAEGVRGQKRACAELEAQAIQGLEQAGFIPDYVSIRDAATLQPIEAGNARAVVLAAARLGRARLIDNVGV
ncbi:MAG: pantoate--beta-alanine ligase [Pseudomonadota bacterium]|nr:pantoate--beta-alanine ligase [Pseudomonadota bacterium]